MFFKALEMVIFVSVKALEMILFVGVKVAGSGMMKIVISGRCETYFIYS